MNSGIYRIYNAVSNKSYIGQAQNLGVRKIHHFSMLRNNKHDNPHLQNAYNKYGEENFCFQPLQYVEDLDLLNEHEQWWIDQYDFDTELYNMLPEAGSRRGYKLSEAVKAKIKAKMRGRKHTEETRKKISAANRGRTVSEETRARQRAANCGKKMSPESIAKRVMKIKKIVHQIDVRTGEVLQTFDSVTGAARGIGLKDHTGISNVLNGRTTTAGGWEYA